MRAVVNTKTGSCSIRIYGLLMWHEMRGIKVRLEGQTIRKHRYNAGGARVLLYIRMIYKINNPRKYSISRVRIALPNIRPESAGVPIINSEIRKIRRGLVVSLSAVEIS